MSVYKEPFYYEIAFGFVDVESQVDLFEEFIDRYSKIEVTRVLDIGCGPSLQLRELAKRGYEAVGIDMSSEMLAYLEQKADEEGVTVKTIQTDMINFDLTTQLDFAFILMGTISYVTSNAEFLQHLTSVANALRKGGLYLIENFRLDWRPERLLGPGSWTRDVQGVMVKVIYDIQVKDALEQLLIETMRMEVNDHGEELVFEQQDETKIIFPQELLALLELHQQFEFLGWFERSQCRKLDQADNDNILLLRKR